MSSRGLLFPGQGAQAVGMGRDFADRYPACRALFNRAGEVLGHDLAAVCFDGPIERLTLSSNAQPGIFVASVACHAAWKARAPDASLAMAAGLSSGEWTALHLAGVVTFDETLRILEARGRFMQEACERTPGGMLSLIGAEETVLDRICMETGAQRANINSREQVVLSGGKESVDAAEKLAKTMGIRLAIRLNVAGAFHSDLMKPAAASFEAFLAVIPFKAPAFPVLSNVTGVPHEGPEAIRLRMVEQVFSPVQWLGNIEYMRRHGVSEFVECGPGKVLTGLVRRIDKTARLHNIQDQSSLETAIQPSST
jgi:[acyl-carrier-protein] S-malonyltransferase